jgi:uncharacterized membrane protein
MPFFTAFASANPMMRVPIFCYCAWLTVAAILNRYLQSMVTRPPIVDDHVPAETIQLTRDRGTSVILGGLTAAAMSLFVPVLGQISLMTIPLWRLLLRKMRER